MDWLSSYALSLSLHHLVFWHFPPFRWKERGAPLWLDGGWVGWSKPIVSVTNGTLTNGHYILVYLCIVITVGTCWQINVCINRLIALRRSRTNEGSNPFQIGQWLNRLQSKEIKWLQRLPYKVTILSMYKDGMVFYTTGHSNGEMESLWSGIEIVRPPHSVSGWPYVV